MTKPRIYLMTDVGSSSLWTDEPFHCMVPFDGLTLRAETKRALEAWSERDWDALNAEDDGHDYDHEADLLEGLRLWQVVRNELAGTHEVGFAFFDPDPWDELSSLKRIVWNPAEAPTIDELRKASEERPVRSDEEDEAIWRQVRQDAIAFCRQRAADRDRRTDPLAGAYEDFAERLDNEQLVNTSQLSILAAAAVRWAARHRGYARWRERQDSGTPPSGPTAEEMTAGELPGILDGLLDDLRPRERRLVLDALREALDGADDAERERWAHLLNPEDEE